MPQIFSKGESVYRCDVCSRNIRVPTNNHSINVVNRCTITLNCPGKLHHVSAVREINSTPAIPVAIPGVQDWFQRNVLFTYTQTIESTEWVIEHNLGSNPTVQVHTTRLIDGEETLVEVEPSSVSIINLNTIVVRFDQATAGIAQCIAFASRNNINPGLHQESTIELDDVLLTNIGELTIATLTSAPLVNVTIVYKNSISNTEVPVDYIGIDATASILSPWASVSGVYIGGKSYTVRSFNVLTTPSAPTVFGTIPIANGTPLYFSGIPSDRGQTLILMGTSPFSSTDKVTDKFIDMASVDITQPQLYYNSGNVYADPAFFRKAYPHIITI